MSGRNGGQKAHDRFRRKIAPYRTSLSYQSSARLLLGLRWAFAAFTMLHPSNVLMACSHGVWRYFSAIEMATVVQSLTLHEATEFLIEKVRMRRHEGGDNLFLVIVKIEALEVDKKPLRFASRPAP